MTDDYLLSTVTFIVAAAVPDVDELLVRLRRNPDESQAHAVRVTLRKVVNNKQHVINREFTRLEIEYTNTALVDVLVDEMARLVAGFKCN